MAHEHLVLVVDDEQQTRDLFADVLRESGAGVALAEDGVAAIEIVKSGLRPCLVLADVRMPRMDGWDLDRELHQVVPEVPVVLLTSDRLLSISAPVLPKPAQPAEIAALVDATCHADREE